MSARLQRLAPFVGALTLAALGIAALGLVRHLPPIAGLSPQVAVPLPMDIGLRFTDVLVTGRQNGQVAWTLSAPRIDATRDRSRLEFSGGIRAVLREDGKPRATFRATSALYEPAAKRLSAAGTIHAQIQPPADPRRDPLARLGAFDFSTDRLHWDIGARTLHCPNEIAVRLQRGEARGENLSLDLRTRAFTLSHFRGRFKIDEGTL